MNRCVGWLSLLAVVIAVVFYASNNTDTDPIQTKLVETQPKKVKQHTDKSTSAIFSLKLEKVERIEWEVDKSFVEMLVSVREPFILENSVATTWASHKLWQNFSYLATHPSLSYLYDVKKGDTGTLSDCNFTRPLANLVKTNYSSKFSIINVTGEEFFKLIQDTDSPHFYYHYHKVPKELKKDVSPSKFLFVGDDDVKASELYMWLGGAGIGPGLHYDMDHNFFVQVVGRKRFVLFPPSATPNLYPYPSLHPCDRKSPIDFDAPDHNKFPKFSQITTGRVAELKPGDLLYVPPYWWHKVHSLTPSVSLSSLSDSGIYRAMSKIINKKLVLDDIEDQTQKIASLIVFLEELYAMIFKEEAMDVINQLYSSWVTNSLNSEDNDSEISGIPSFCLDLPITDIDPSIFEEDIRFIYTNLQNVQLTYGTPVDISRSDIKTIQRIELGVYTEALVNQIIGANNALLFFTKCFPAERLTQISNQEQNNDYKDSNIQK